MLDIFAQYFGMFFCMLTSLLGRVEIQTTSNQLNSNNLIIDIRACIFFPLSACQSVSFSRQSSTGHSHLSKNNEPMW